MRDSNAPTGRCRVQIKGYGVVQTVNVCTIFVVSGLTLKTDDAVQSLKHPRGLAYGLVAILALTPMFGFVVQNIPFSEEAFATGLTVFCAVPTTLSSGVALVQAVRSCAPKRRQLVAAVDTTCSCEFLTHGGLRICQTADSARFIFEGTAAVTNTKLHIDEHPRAELL